MRIMVFGVAVLGVLFPAGAAFAQVGTIKGTIELAGPMPEVEALVVTKDQDFCGNTVSSRRLIVNERKVQYGVAYLEGVSGEAPPQNVTLMNRDCSFDPPVLATTAKSIIRLGNGDPILHNSHLYFRRRTMANLALPHQGDAIENSRALRRPGLVEALCDAHEWMSAKIWVFDHPFYAVTDETGAFEIGDVPGGTYTLKVWHEVLGEQEQVITIEPGAATSVSLVFGTTQTTTAEDNN